MKTLALLPLVLPATAGTLCAQAAPASDIEAVELEPLVVTGTKTSRLITETPVKTELILQEDFHNYNITTFKDAIKLIPSARFENECQNCGVNQIQLLGLGTEYTSILFDGAPIYSGLAKVYGADIFPSIFINRIEVVKGGSSVLYGPEAIAGVINLITAEPQKSGLETRLSTKSLDGDATEWNSSFIANHVDAGGLYSISVYGMYLDREALDLTGDGFSELPEFENKVIGVQGWLHPFKNVTLKGTYQYMDQKHRGGDQLGIPEEDARVAESLKHEIHMTHLDWKHGVSDSFDYNLRMSYLYIERESFYGSRGDNEQRAYENAGFTGDVTEEFIEDNQNLIDEVAHKVWGFTENEVFYVDTQFNHYLGAHTVSYGVQYRYEDLKDGSLYDPTAVKTEDDFSNTGVYLQDQWIINKKFEIDPGLRVDKHDNVDGEIYSPRLAARYSASEEWTLRASWSTGFNAPGAFNEDKHIGVNNGGAIFLVNEAGLEEESSQTWSFGAEYQPNALDGQFIIHSQLHYTLLKDTFEIDDSGELSGDPNLWLRINGPDSEVFVWESNLNWKFDERWRIDAGLSYIYARFDEEIERVTGLATDKFIERPEWTGHIGVSYENHDLFDAHAIFSYTGTMIALGQESAIWRNTPEFYVLDLEVSKSFSLGNGTDLVLALGVDNVFDERQKDVMNNGEERDPTYLYGPSYPRSYYASARLSW
ncbi:MAG: TonB-dependent receptor [Opitutales bacterium]|nr:TonB-dependent receptor [Opitutales bacterium]